MLPKAIVIVGPTASGKSELAVNLAKQYNGEVISADSRQVYKGLDIGSGKITKKEMRGVPHYLLDVASPKRIFTVARYQKFAQAAVKDILKRGKTPSLCGGTGLYVNSVIHGTAFPAVPPNPKLRRKLEKEPTDRLFSKLKKLDPQRAKTIDAKNRVRLIRALEIVETLGRVPPLQNQPLKLKTLIIGIKKDKKTLKALIKKRLAGQLKNGLVKEVENLHRQGLSWRRLENLGLEYRWSAYFLQNKISRQEMIENLQKEIWRYAKRQMTWFKKMKNVRWIKTEKEAIKAI